MKTLEAVHGIYSVVIIVDFEEASVYQWFFYDFIKPATNAMFKLNSEEIEIVPITNSKLTIKNSDQRQLCSLLWHFCGISNFLSPANHNMF